MTHDDYALAMLDLLAMIAEDQQRATEALRSFGVAADVAAAAMAKLGEVLQTIDWSDVREYEAAQ